LVLEISLANNWEKYQEIRQDWIDLLGRTAHAKPFSDPDFCQLWVKRREKYPSQPHVVTLNNNQGMAVALAPFCVTTTKKKGIRIKRLRFMVSTPYFDSDLVPENLNQGYTENMLRNALRNRSVDIVELYSIPRESANLPRIEKALKNMGLSTQVYHQDPWKNDKIQVTGTWEEYLAEKSQQNRYNLRRTARKIEKNGDIEIERHRDLKPGTMDHITQIVKGGWKNASEYSTKGFWREFIKLLDRKQWLDLFLLRYDQKPAAFLLFLRYRSTMYAIQTAYDSVLSRYSPGVYLIQKAIERTFNQPEGITEIDFLTHYPHTARFSNQTGTRLKIRGFPKKPRSRLLSMGFRIRSRIRETRGKKTVQYPTTRQVLEHLDHLENQEHEENLRHREPLDQ